MFRFADLPLICQFAVLRFADHKVLRFADLIIFADLKLPQIRIYFLLTNTSLKCSHSNLRTTFGFWDSFETQLYGMSQSKIYLFNIRDKAMRIWINNTAFFLQICRFAICGLGHQGNLRILDLRIDRYKFADWDTSEICGFAIA